jgi:pyruvate dehydrogenase E2 component (dihydrolipoamide acetyltransferase)
VAYEFKLPDLGEGLTEAEIARWLVAEGDQIHEDQPLVEVQTDKTTVEIPSPRAGTVLKILVEEGDIAPVGAVLVVIGEEGEQLLRAVEQGEPVGDKADREPLVAVVPPSGPPRLCGSSPGSSGWSSSGCREAGRAGGSWKPTCARQPERAAAGECRSGASVARSSSR